MKRTSRFISTLALMLMALGAAPSAEAANLKARSATIDPATGYPTWYQDNNNLALTNCLDNSAFCLPTGTVLPLPANKADINAQNFPPESFYFLASGPVGASSLGGTISGVLYIAALEAGFAANVVDGGQAVFTRIRIRANVTLPGTYVVTHPYGTDTFDVPATAVPPLGDGIRAINFSEDIPGLVANQFDASLTSRMGPFLTRADGTFITDPTTGNRYIGQPGALVAVTGSPLGNNFVTITAPNGDNLTFSTFDLQGKIIGLDVAPKTNLNLGPINIAIANAPGTLLIPQTVTVTNTTGNPITFAADLNATGIKGGADAADFIIAAPTQPAAPAPALANCVAGPVAAGAKCGFDVTFKPAAVAKTARVATLLLAPTAAIAANNPPPVTLNLSGTAQVLVTAAAVGDGTITPATQAVGAGGAATFTVKPLTKKFKVKDVAEGVTLFAPSPTDATVFTIPNVGAADHVVHATFMPSGDLDASGTLDINDAVKALKIVAGVQAADTDDPDNTAIKVAPLVGGVPAPDATRVQTNIGDVLVILRRVIGLETW